MKINIGGRMEDKKNKVDSKISRRSFLTALSAAGISVAGGALAYTQLKFLTPTVDYGIDKVFRVGSPDKFKIGTVLALEKEKVVIINTDDGFAAISLICTHLGCTVRPSGAGFECPCHGSQFDENGLNTGGPAPRPLDWYQIGLAPNGELEVDKGIILEKGTYFKV